MAIFNEISLGGIELSGTPFPRNFKAYAELTVPTPVSGQLTDVVLLLSINSLPLYFKDLINTNGQDIRIYDEIGNQLARDVIRCVNAAGVGFDVAGIIAYRYTQTIHSNSKIRVYAGDPTLTEPSASSTYGQYNTYPSTVRGFWPFGLDDDRTSYVNVVTTSGSPTVAGQNGPLNGSLSTELISASSQYGTANASVPAGRPLTMFASMYMNTVTVNQNALSLGDTSADTNYARLYFLQAATDVVRFNQVGNFNRSANATTLFSGSTWHNTAGTEVTTTSRYVYFNGANEGSQLSTLTPGAYNVIGIGALVRTTATGFFNGRLSFVRLDTVAHADNSVKYWHDMIADPDQSSFYSSITFVESASGLGLNGVADVSSDVISSGNVYDEVGNNGSTHEGNVSVNCRYNVSGVNGVEFSGVTNLNSIYRIISSSGVEFNGIASVIFFDTTTTTSGIKLNGLSTVALNYSFIGSGGGDIGGKLLISSFAESSGGLLLNGKSLRSFNNTAVNGLKIGGVGANVNYGFLIFSGKSLVSHTAPVSGGMELSGKGFRSYYQIISGGLLLNGKSIQTHTQFTSGGMKFGGSANTNHGIIIFGGISSYGLTFPLNATGGLKLLGNGIRSYENTSTGGLKFSGSIRKIFSYRIRATGGLSFTGSSNVNYDFLILSGKSNVGRIISRTGSGGSKFTGTSKIVRVLSPGVESRGVAIGGNTPSFAEKVGSGGIKLSGTPKITGLTNERGTGYIYIKPTHLMSIHKRLYASGGIETNGDYKVKFSLYFITDGRSADAPPDFAGVSVGYTNSFNPTLANLRWYFDLAFPWTVSVNVSLDTEIIWNTGTTPLYFYRVVGKQRNVDKCDPIEVGEECCRQFIMNVPARNIPDLCEKMRQRRWKWPVLLVQKFSQPVVNVPGLNLDPDCNVLEEVEICNNIVCQDFCIDHDLETEFGWSAYSQVNVFLKYTVNKSPLLLGSYSSYDHTGDNLKYSIVGQFSVSGSAIVYSDFITVGGTILFGGQGFSQSSRWEFLSGQTEFVENNFPTSYTQNISEPSDTNWQIDIHDIDGDGDIDGRDFLNLQRDTTRIYLGFQRDDIHVYASTANFGYTKFLIVKNFEFNLPLNSEIVGIEAIVEKQATGSVVDEEVYLTLNDEIISDNLASGDIWSLNVDEIKSYGGSTNIWRDEDDEDYLGLWEAVDINDIEFGLAIRAKGSVSQPESVAKIDYIELRIYWHNVDNRINMGGRIGVVSSNYTWDSLNVLELYGGHNVKVGYKFKSTGRGFMGPYFTSLTLGGYYITPLYYTSSGVLNVSGFASLNQGINFSGISLNQYISDTHVYEPDGLINVSGDISEKISWRISASGGMFIGGDTGINNHINDTVGGMVRLLGSSIALCSAWNFTSDGNVIFVGLNSNATYRSSNIGLLSDVFGLHDFVQDVSIKFFEEVQTQDITTTEFVTECQCADMNLIMPMTHSINKNNKLSQFLLQNNYSLDRQLQMSYNRINDSWLHNSVFEGLSANGQRERWTIIFQLQCTNLVSGLEIEHNIWRFSAQIIEKNLVTMADYDTRITVSFLPDLVCKEGFNIKMDINTQKDIVSLTPLTTLYEYTYHDNINLFNNSYWIKNPIINFELSQIGIERLIARYPVNIG